MIVFDSDATMKRSANMTEANLSDPLTKAGACVRIAPLPATHDGARWALTIFWKARSRSGKTAENAVLGRDSARMSERCSPARPT